MATKKKKAARKSSSINLGGLEARLPGTLRGYVREVESLLNRLEKEITKAGANARSSSARLLREASRWVGALEERGEGAWDRLTGPYRREAARLLDRLESALTPAKKKAKKKATKKKVAKKKATKKKAKRKTTKKKPVRKKVAKKSSSKRGTSKKAAKKTTKKKATKKKSAKKKVSRKR